jgi:hypothetical protein
MIEIDGGSHRLKKKWMIEIERHKKEKRDLWERNRNRNKEMGSRVRWLSSREMAAGSNRENMKSCMRFAGKKECIGLPTYDSFKLHFNLNLWFKSDSYYWFSPFSYNFVIFMWYILYIYVRQIWYAGHTWTTKELL